MIEQLIERWWKFQHFVFGCMWREPLFRELVILPLKIEADEKRAKGKIRVCPPQADQLIDH